MKLSEKKCIPCEDSSIEPMSCDQAHELLNEYKDSLLGWNMNDACTHIVLEKIFPDFMSAMQWVNKVADSAELKGHHPDISIFYNRVQLDIWTHSIGGLSENDFILAAAVNEL